LTQHLAGRASAVTEKIQTAAGAEEPEGELAAICAFACVPGMGARTLARVSKAFGSLAGALQAGPDAIHSKSAELRLQRRTREFLAQLPDLEKLGAWALCAARAAGARAITRRDESYPELLRRIDDPPPVLFVRGELLPSARRVALVGARAADEAALRLSRQLAEGLAAAAVEVVSGGARGVDAEAHAGALWGRGRTVAVLGSGIDVAYPPENAALFERIAAGGGALVSELPPGTPASRPNFPRRNRTIAGLSHATVVVRATAESGALITARHAAAVGRPIFAVPGEPGDPLAAGPRDLLAAGAATPVTSAQEIVDLLGWSPDGAQAARKDSVSPSRPPAASAPAAASTGQPLEGPALRVWEVLDERRALHVDALAARAQLRAQEALRGLTELELKGLIYQKPGKVFVRRPGLS
jgi:DNA processing protein